MKLLVYSSLLSLFLSSCTTYSITMVHSQGSASDVVDEVQTPTTNVSPDISVPAIP